MIAIVAIAVVLIVAFLIFYLFKKQKQPISTTISYVYGGYSSIWPNRSPNLVRPRISERSYLSVSPVTVVHNYKTLSELRQAWMKEGVVRSDEDDSHVLSVAAFPWVNTSSSWPYRVSGPALMWSSSGEVKSVKVVQMEGINSESSQVSEREIALEQYAVTFKVTLKQGASFFIVCASLQIPDNVVSPDRSIIYISPSTLTPNASTVFPVLSLSDNVKITPKTAEHYESEGSQLWEAASQVEIS